MSYLKNWKFMAPALKKALGEADCIIVPSNVMMTMMAFEVNALFC